MKEQRMFIVFAFIRQINVTAEAVWLRHRVNNFPVTCKESAKIYGVDPIDKMPTQWG